MHTLARTHAHARTHARTRAQGEVPPQGSLAQATEEGKEQPRESMLEEAWHRGFFIKKVRMRKRCSVNGSGKGAVVAVVKVCVVRVLLFLVVTSSGGGRCWWWKEREVASSSRR